VQVDQCAAILLGNNFQGSFKRSMAVAAGGSEHIAQQAVRVHADQDRLRGIIDVTANQCHVGRAAVDFAFVGDQAEFSVPGFYHRLAHAWT